MKDMRCKVSVSPICIESYIDRIHRLSSASSINKLSTINNGFLFST